MPHPAYPAYLGWRNKALPTPQSEWDECGEFVHAGCLCWPCSKPYLELFLFSPNPPSPTAEQANPYKVALRKFIPLLLLSLILLLGIGMGIVLFIIPGIYLLLRLMFAQYTFLEQGGIVRSFKESWRLTEGHFYTQVVVLLVAFGLILLGAITFGLGLIFIQPLVTLYLVTYYRYLQGTAIEQIDEPIA